MHYVLGIPCFILSIICLIYGLVTIWKRPCRCRRCRRFFSAYVRRQNTAYHDDALNYETLCDLCQDESNDYWDEQWRDYWAGCL